MTHTFPTLAAVTVALAGASTPVVSAADASPAPKTPVHHHVSHHRRRAHTKHPLAAASHHTKTPLDQRYLKLYHEAQAELGTRAPGRNIVRWGLTATKPATVAAIKQSIGTLSGMVAAAQPTTIVAAATAPVEQSSAATAEPQETSAPAASGLTACIVDAESGGDPDAVNASGHMGEGQWAESTWIADGGGQYGATPLDASAAEQQQVIANQVAAGNTGQWTDYDGC